MKIGVFVGCFDPVHNSHIKIVTYLTEHVLDKVVIVPASNNYERKGLTDIEQRIRMLKLTFENNIKIEICDKRFCNENVHTFMVMDALKKRFPYDELFIICGSDNLKTVETWRGAEHLLSNFKMIAVSRDKENLETLIGNDVFLRDHASNIYILSIVIESISSTQIRTNVQKGKPIDDLTTKEVVDHIKKYKLFK
ncbi:MAG: nicotinate (nicotinamide) nucleotide adenylyltransferase [Clostridia bacterium]